MRLIIAAIGRMKDGPERELAARYVERARQAGRALGFTALDEVELPESRARDAAERKREEAAALLKAIGPDALIVALDERGSALTSPAFASKIGQWRDDGARTLAFVIGGADGLDSTLHSSAKLTLALGTLTWPHQLARILIAEQIYRAMTILSGHPYHRV